MDKTQDTIKLHGGGPNMPEARVQQSAFDFLTLTLEVNRHCMDAWFQVLLWPWGLQWTQPAVPGESDNVIRPTFGRPQFWRRPGVAPVIPFRSKTNPRQSGRP